MGTVEIVVSYYDTQSDGNDEGYLVAYAQADYDWTQAGNWNKVIIADGFTTNFFLFGNTMSHGMHRTYYRSRY